MRSLGTGGLKISVVGYGAWEAGGDFWGPNESDEQVVSAIRAALDAGMSWIDTAEVYGRGRSEELVGKAIAGRRDELLVFTKLAPSPPGSGFRPGQVKPAIQASLGRLGIDHVDLYQLHWPDDRVPVEETWGAMTEVADAGLVTHIGVSNFDLPLVERCEGIRHVDSVQNPFSLLHQDDRTSLLPALDAWGIGYLAYSPLALGLLSGAIALNHRFHERDFRGGARGDQPEYFRAGSFERNLGLVDQLRRTARRLGVSVPVLALRWVIQQGGVTAAIAGTRNAAHTQENASAGDLHLDAETLAEIDAIFT